MVFCISSVARPWFIASLSFLTMMPPACRPAQRDRRRCWPRRPARRPRPWSAYRAGAACASCSVRPAPQFAIKDEAAGDCDALDGGVDRLGQHRRHRFAAAAVRHAGHLAAAAQHEQLADQMRQAARAGVGVVDLAGVGLAVIDELLERLPRRVRIHDENLEALGHADDRDEILDRIVAGAGRHGGNHCQHARVAHQQRVAVRRAVATTRAPSAPPAPGRFSITTGWPSLGCRICEASRAGTSVGPPAAAGRISLIGLLG